MTKNSLSKSYFIVAFAIFFFLFSFYLASGFIWYQYSPSGDGMTMSLPSSDSGRFDLGYTNYSISNSLTSAVTTYNNGFNQLQRTTISVPFGNPTNIYSFFTNGQYLTGFDSNLMKTAEISSGSQVGTLFLLDYADNTIKILGLFNDGDIKFKYYYYNVSGGTFYLLSSSSAIVGHPDSLRCISSGIFYLNYSGSVCFGYSYINGASSNLNTYYDNGSVVSLSLPGNSRQSLPDFIGVGGTDLEFLTISDSELALMYLNGTKIFNRTDTDIYMDAKFFRGDILSGYKIAYLTSQIGGGSTNLKLYMRRLDGTSFNSVLAKSIASGSSAIMSFSKLSVLDYNNDNIEELAVSYSNGTATTINVYNTAGSIIKTLTYTESTLSGAPPTLGGDLISAKLNGDSTYDFIVNRYAGTRSSVIDGSTGNKFISLVGNMAPSDTKLNGRVSLIGYNSTDIFDLVTGFVNSAPIITGLTYNAYPVLNTPLNIIIIATDADNDAMAYYLDCGNGNITAVDFFNVKTCTYATLADYTITAYTTDLYHLNFTSSSGVVHAGQLGIGTGSGISTAINPVLGLFPPYTTLTFSQRMGIMLIVMLITAVVILFAGSQIGSNGMHSLIIYIILIILIVEFLFFTAIHYIPLSWIIILILASLTISYFKIKGNGGS
jgi:hypothetical protein